MSTGALTAARLGSGPLTMSSREIADLLDCRHDNVKVAIERLATRGVIEFPATQEIPTATKPVTVYLLEKRPSYIVVAQLSPEFTAALVDRWQALEALQAQSVTAAPMVPTTLAQALRLAADQADQIERNEAALALAAPKVEFVDRYVASPAGAKGIREVCKVLNANEREFIAFLLERHILYRLDHKLMPHSSQSDTGRFVVRTGQALANEHQFEQTKFTPKGFVWVAGEWAKHKLRKAQEAAQR